MALSYMPFNGKRDTHCIYMWIIWAGNNKNTISRPQGYKTFSWLTQLSIKFQLLIKTKMLKNKLFLLSNSHVVFIMLINVKMPTVVGILTLISMIIFHAQLSGARK